MTERGVLAHQLVSIMYRVVFEVPRLLCSVDGVWFSHTFGLCWLPHGTRKEIFPPSVCFRCQDFLGFACVFFSPSEMLGGGYSQFWAF